MDFYDEETSSLRESQSLINQEEEDGRFDNHFQSDDETHNQPYYQLKVKYIYSHMSLKRYYLIWILFVYL